MRKSITMRVSFDRLGECILHAELWRVHHATQYQLSDLVLASALQQVKIAAQRQECFTFVADTNPAFISGAVRL
jgi:hypothetical protein